MTSGTGQFWLVFLLWISLPSGGKADGLSRQLARRTAMDFMAASIQGDDSKRRAAAELHEVDLKIHGPRPYLYRYAHDRFVMVASDGRRAAVLAYGRCHDDDDEATEGIEWMAGAVGDRLPNRSIAGSTGQAVAPMIASVRHQSEPFNLRCPSYSVGNGTDRKHAKVGCVATALEQIVTYHRYPKALKATLSGWTTDDYHIDDIKEGTLIDYDGILPRYEEGRYSGREADAVACLSYYCGVAAHMNWGIGESGAHLRNLEENMKVAFGYPYVRYLCSTDYSPVRWQRLVDSELMAGRPILYAGYTSLMQGHAFVVDGKDERGFYHVNWGYGGNYDGYYDLAVLNTFENPDDPTEEGKWTGNFCLQEMLVMGKEDVQYNPNDRQEGEYPKLKVDSVLYSRLPDRNGYVTVDVFVRNLWADSITAAVELFTYSPGAEKPFRDADYVGLTGLKLAPKSQGRMRAYCRFSELGTRVFAVSEDGSTFLYSDTLEVADGQRSGVSVLSADTLWEGNGTMQFHIVIANNSDTEWAGNMLTYSLFEGDYTASGGEWRKWRILNLSPGEEITDTVAFASLKNGRRYTFVVRNPWLPALVRSFVVESPVGIGPVIPSCSVPDGIYTFDGLRVGRIRHKGVYWIRRNGKTRKVYIVK